MAETKIIYHIDEEETPYLVKLPVPPEKVTLADFKNVLSNRPVHNYKFFFKSMDQDFGRMKLMLCSGCLDQIKGRQARPGQEVYAVPIWTGWAQPGCRRKYRPRDLEEVKCRVLERIEGVCP
ncbi:hypothetical protein lerEdw1_019766 [Lerista edwardsae]|nr:hypothetical protein lerEdw1_019766 [Lerista edwardsae]